MHQYHEYETVAILATGDEIVEGDILNTNTQTIARILTNKGITVGLHLSVSDEENQITKTIQYLLDEHHALIIMGGLGPTADDRTRFALSKACHQELVFHPSSWDRICERLTKFKVTIPENNKQQAYFPKGAIVFPNTDGTADACYLEYEGKHIFMLPGPPGECLPLFNQNVLPILEKNISQKKQPRQHWLLLGVSEGHFSHEMDRLAEKYNATIGYRVDFPYLEIKINEKNQEFIDAFEKILQKDYQEKMISRENKKASQQLREYMMHSTSQFYINDPITAGCFEYILHDTFPLKNVHFCKEQEEKPPNDIHISLKGLKEFWEHLDTDYSQIEIQICHQSKQRSIQKKIRYKKNNLLEPAVEIISWEILNILNQSN